MEPGSSNSQRFEGRRSAQREIFLEQIRALRSVPGGESAENPTDSSPIDSTTANILSSFGSLSTYQIDLESESALFDLEAARLLDSLEAPNLLFEDDIAIWFPSQTSPDQSFSTLNTFLRTLMCSLAISALDNIMFFRAYKMKFGADDAIISCAGQRIQECQMDISALGYTRIIRPNSYWELRNPGRMNLESADSISYSRAAGYHAIVDYITAVVARLLASGFEDDSVHDQKPSWHIMTLTVLAKMSAKMKVLGHRLSDFKIQVHGESTPGHVLQSQSQLPLGAMPAPPPSLPSSVQLPPHPQPPASVHQPPPSPLLPIPTLPSSASLSSLPQPPPLANFADFADVEEVMYSRDPARLQTPLATAKSLSSESLDTISSSELSEESDMTSDSEGRSQKLPGAFLPKERRSRKNNYLFDMYEISTMLFHIMWHVLSELETRSISGQKTSDLDISVIVYATGTQKTSAMLYQKAGHEVAGSQTGVSLGVCRRMFDTLGETARAVQSRPNVGEDEHLHLCSDPMRPRLRFSMNNKSGRDSAAGIALAVRSIPEFVSIMIPLSCMNPSVADRVFRACSKVGASDIIRGLHAAGQDFTATISLCSVIEAYNIDSTSRRAQSSPLSQARFYLRQNCAEFTPETAAQRQAPRWLQNMHSLRATYRQLSQPHCHQNSDATREWAIEGTAVTVRCLNYTLPVMVGCGALVTGGILAGFLVGERIAGVDPFNLTMFCWIIAGFIILVAKSIRVVNWPWRDFLLGRVTTRSVSELASVTGLDEQFIIFYLLSREGSLPLTIRGPFNSVFARAGEGDSGFSIDVQPTVRTLFASGMVVLEVLSSGGPALVCMDLRPEMNRFRPGYLRKMVNSQNKRVSVLACVEPPRGDEDNKNIIFRYQRIRWEKVVGVCNDEDGRVG